MGNVISRNSGDGVLITGLSATNNQLQFNVIGVGADFTTPLPNTMGVVISTGIAERRSAAPRWTAARWSASGT